MKIKICFFLAAIIFLASCTGSRFTSRKYMKGYYVSHKTKSQSLNRNESEQALMASSNTKAPLYNSIPKKQLIIETNELGELKQVSKFHNKTLNTPAKKAFHQLVNLKQNSEGKFVSSKPNTENKKPAKQGGKIEKNALISFICSMAGIAFSIIGFIVTVATLNYACLLLFVPAIVLGIVGMSKGFKGIKTHKKEHGSVGDLVFSIVGAAGGLAAIILGCYFAIYSLLVIAVFSQV